MTEAISGYVGFVLALLYLYLVKHEYIAPSEMMNNSILVFLLGASAAALHAAPSLREKYKQRAVYVEQAQEENRELKKEVRQLDKEIENKK